MRTNDGMTKAQKGRHAELLAQTALLAHGYTVSEPVTVEPFDLTIKEPGDKRTYYVQVKTAIYRNSEKYNGEWLVIRGAKNSGEVYKKEEVDYFIAVHEGNVYMFDNNEQSEYWARPYEAHTKWRKLN